MSKAARLREKAKKEAERLKKAKAKEARMKNPGKGSRYQEKREAIRKGDALPFGQAAQDTASENDGRDVTDQFFHRLHSGRASSIQDIRNEDRPEWEVARDATGLKPSRFRAPKVAPEIKKIQNQIDNGLFQTEAYFLNTRACTELRVGFMEYATIDADLNFEPGVKPTSLIAKKTGEVENVNKIYSTDPDTLPVWEIRRLTGLGAKTPDGKDKSIVVLEGVVKSEDEMKDDLAFWCKTYGQKTATQDKVSGAVVVTKYDY